MDVKASQSAVTTARLTMDKVMDESLLPVDYLQLLEANGCTWSALEQIRHDAENEPDHLGTVEWTPGHLAVFETVYKIPAAATKTGTPYRQNKKHSTS
jgi:hypothetical protein